MFFFEEKEEETKYTKTLIDPDKVSYIEFVVVVDFNGKVFRKILKL